MAPVASTSTASSSRKRKTPAAAAEPKAQQPLATLTGSLELGADSDEDDEVDAEGNAILAEEENDDEDEFPELDVGSSDEDDDEDAVPSPPAPAPRSRRARRKAPSPVAAALGRGDDADDEDDDDALAEDDGAVLTDEDSGSQSGYNSSDLDGSDADDHEPRHSPFGSPSTNATSLARSRSASPVSRFISRNTVKPDERDHALPDKPVDERAGVLVVSKLTGRPKRVYRDVEAGYGSESSTEDTPNRVGDIPDHWYDDLPHIGYDINGKKVMRPAQGDELDRFLSTVEDPDSWTSVQDKLLQQNVNLTDAELDIIRRLQQGENPDENYDPYAPQPHFFTQDVETMPISARPAPKSRFIASKWEHKKVMKIVRAIRQGRIVPQKPSSTKPQFYALWSAADSAPAEHAMHMPAPAQRLPTDAESYNPPAEHLLDADEERAWDETEKADRKREFKPAKFESLRKVPAYHEFVQERFERCLDLYLAPRMRKTRLNIDPESLIPKLPSPKELRPFPTATAIRYSHPGGPRVRCIGVDPTGNWVATGAEDGTVRVWELQNGRLAWRCEVGKGPVSAVEWCPDRAVGLIGVAIENRVALICPTPILPTELAHHSALVALKAVTGASTAAAPRGDDVSWLRGTDAERKRGILVQIDVPGTPKQVTWHRKGDYFATVAADAANKSVLIHQLSKHQTQSPFKKTKGAVQKVAFHPAKPHFFVVTQRYVRIYDLVGQTLIKTLQPGLKWLSSVDIHPLGDNLIVGSYDKKLCWFDLDLSTKPYKTLRYQARAIRSVHYHPAYPLFASCSDDGTINVFHGTVYSDLLQNPLIVPLKVLRGHAVKSGLGVLDVRWHPTLPWLVSAGSDGEARLWCP